MVELKVAISAPKGKLSLYDSVTYEITVSGRLEADMLDNAELMVFHAVEGRTVVRTTVRGVFDQAALHSLLQRLYSAGYPLVALAWVDQAFP